MDEPYRQALRSLAVDAARMAQRTADRLDVRGANGRELAAETREELLSIAGDLEATARELRRQAQPRAGLFRHGERLAGLRP